MRLRCVELKQQRAGKIENYEVHDGVLRCKPKKGGTVYTKEQFSGFAVQFQFRFPAGGNNGLATSALEQQQ